MFKKIAFIVIIYSVVGRKFQDVGDHAKYMGDRDCSNIFAALTSK